jgi:threonine synthase
MLCRSSEVLMYQLNDRLTGFICPRCRHKYPRDFPAADRGQGCPSCQAEGYPVSLVLTYDDRKPWSLFHNQRGMRRYTARLPYLTFPRLGGADTPLVPVPDLAHEVGIADLWFKNEGQNPTGSHKDRMSPFVVARAAALGIDTVAVASSGNAGASLAAYAAAAGLNCVVVATKDIYPAWAQAIKMCGAELILVDESLERWSRIRAEVEAGRWYPATNHQHPPLGSNPYGLQGYKTVAWEILESTAPAKKSAQTRPTVIIVPTARGDHLWGIWQGLVEAHGAGMIRQLPRLVAAEPFPRLSKALAGADYRADFPGQALDMPSIAGNTATFQALHALRESNGLAVVAGGRLAQAAQIRLAERGYYVERSSAAALAALEQLVAQRQIKASDRVVLLLTSHGYKDQLADD